MAWDAASPGREPGDLSPPPDLSATATVPRPAAGRRRAARRSPRPLPRRAGHRRRPAGGDRPAARQPRPAGRRWSFGLAAICLVQAVTGLILANANTAFTDEADYLWIGRLVLGHWLRGTSWPAGYAHRVLSGSAFIYPPAGATADGIAGLTGARTLSLIFMIGATVLVYLAGSRLLGRAEGLIAAALWAFSAPALRLVFATYDPMSVFLAALSGWLAVRAAAARRPALVAMASGLALGLADATAYSGLVIAPVVIVFAFLTALPALGSRRAWACTGWLVAAWAASFCLLITFSGAWAGIAFTVIDRKVADHQQAGVIAGSAVVFSWFVLVTALLGAAMATRERDRPRAALLAFLGLTALVVPAAQLTEGTAWALDKHLAYGIWFAVLASAYACRVIARQAAGLLRGRAGLVTAAGAVVLALPLAANCVLARQTLQSWANSAAFVAALRPVVARGSGPIFASAQQRVAEFYTPQGEQWTRWKTSALPLDPRGLPRGRWYAYYAARLRTCDADVIALFYTPPGPAGRGGGASWLAAHRGHMYAALRDLRNFQRSEPGVRTLTRAIERDARYRLVAVGPYDSNSKAGVFAIWRRV